MPPPRCLSLDPSKDLYALLGVHPGADDEQLRQAWRRIAMRWHPDRAGHGATATFQELSAVRDILADPISRAAYDRRRRAADPAVARAPASAGTASPAPSSARGRARPVMLSRLSGPLPSLIACGIATVHGPGLITLQVSKADAVAGGFATIALQIEVRCAGCATAVRPVACGRCGGKGTERVLFSAWLTVPPGVKTGQVLAPSVELRGTITPVRFHILLAGDR